MATLRVSESKSKSEKVSLDLVNKNTDEIIQMINDVINEPFSCSSTGGAGFAGFFTNLFSCITPAAESTQQIELVTIPASASAPTPQIERPTPTPTVIHVIPKNPQPRINIEIGTENIILEMDLTKIITENSANLPLTGDIWEKIYRDTLFMKEAMLLACVIKFFAKSIREETCKIDLKKIVNNTLLHSLKYVEYNINDQNAHIVDLMFKLNQQSSATSSSASTSSPDEFYLHIFATAMKHVNEFPDITYMNEDIFIVMKL